MNMSVSKIYSQNFKCLILYTTTDIIETAKKSLQICGTQILSKDTN